MLKFEVARALSTFTHQRSNRNLRSNTGLREYQTMKLAKTEFTYYLSVKMFYLASESAVLIPLRSVALLV